jgi:hypothetical protein
MKIVFVIFLTLFTALSGAAQKDDRQGMPATMLYKLCEQNKAPLTNTQDLAQAVCIGYMSGWADGVNRTAVLEQGQPYLVKLDPALTASKMREIFLAYMKVNAGKEIDVDADNALARSLYAQGLLKMGAIRLECH